MKSDLELIPGILAASVGRTGDDELTFAFPDVLDAIKLCSTNLIAVLGPDLFKISSDGLYQTVKLSGYHLTIKTNPQSIEQWPEYVKINNALAEEFVRQNPAGDDHVYILSTASWREFCEIQDIRRAGGP
jgi:hypothetical protein